MKKPNEVTPKQLMDWGNTTKYDNKCYALIDYASQHPELKGRLGILNLILSNSSSIEEMIGLIRSAAVVEKRSQYNDFQLIIDIMGATPVEVKGIDENNPLGYITLEQAPEILNALRSLYSKEKEYSLTNVEMVTRILNLNDWQKIAYGMYALYVTNLETQINEKA